jgi:hypothetical protein
MRKKKLEIIKVQKIDELHTKSQKNTSKNGELHIDDVFTQRSNSQYLPLLKINNSIKYNEKLNILNNYDKRLSKNNNDKKLSKNKYNQNEKKTKIYNNLLEKTKGTDILLKRKKSNKKNKNIIILKKLDGIEYPTQNLKVFQIKEGYNNLLSYLLKNKIEIIDMLYKKKILKNKCVPIKILVNLFVNYINNDIKIILS